MASITRDKKVHFAAGILAGFVGGWLTYIFVGPVFVGPISVLTAFLAGYIKEIYDFKIKKTRFDWNDLVATCIGGYTASLIWFGFSLLPGY